jgi:hypothetical protein
MATYATAEQLAEYVEDNPDVTLPLGDATERLLERAERRVDAVLGPYEPDETTGLKLDPGDLTDAQAGALARATCAGAEHELVVGLAFYVGEDDYLPGELTVLRRAGRTAPKILEELSGSGLVTFSGTVAATT